VSRPNKYSGVVVPMVTPFTDQGKVDLGAAERIVEFLVENHTHPFVLGTTGEGASVPLSQRPGLVETVVKKTASRSVTFAGIGGNCVSESIELAKRYFDLGIDAVVAHLPSYYPLSADAMLRYYESLAEKIGGPLIVYNITITTHMSIPLEVVQQLSNHPNIVGLKDSQDDAERIGRAAGMFKDRKDFTVLVGCEQLSATGLLAGADGIVPGAANFAPKIYRDLYDAAVKGESNRAVELQDKVNEIVGIYKNRRGLSKSLAALKVVMHELGLCGQTVLPPLYEPSEQEKTRIRERLSRLGISRQHQGNTKT